MKTLRTLFLFISFISLPVACSVQGKTGSLTPTLITTNQIHVAQHQKRENYLGIQYRDNPPDLREFAAWMIGNSSNKPTYLVSWVVDASCEFQPCPAGTTSMLWLGTIVSYDSSGNATKKVLDVINLPDLPADFSEQLFHLCRQNGVNDPEIVAIAKYDAKQEFLSDVVRAWRANRQQGKLEEISVEGISCENPGWGT